MCVCVCVYVFLNSCYNYGCVDFHRRLKNDIEVNNDQTMPGKNYSAIHWH